MFLHKTTNERQAKKKPTWMKMFHHFSSIIVMGFRKSMWLFFLLLFEPLEYILELYDGVATGVTVRDFFPWRVCCRLHWFLFVFFVVVPATIVVVCCVDGCSCVVVVGVVVVVVSVVVVVWFSSSPFLLLLRFAAPAVVDGKKRFLFCCCRVRPSYAIFTPYSYVDVPCIILRTSYLRRKTHAG